MRNGARAGGIKERIPMANTTGHKRGTHDDRRIKEGREKAELG